MKHVKLFENFNIDSLKSLKSFSFLTKFILNDGGNKPEVIKTFVSELIENLKDGKMFSEHIFVEELPKPSLKISLIEGEKVEKMEDFITFPISEEDFIELENLLQVKGYTASRTKVAANSRKSGKISLMDMRCSG